MRKIGNFMPAKHAKEREIVVTRNFDKLKVPSPVEGGPRAGNPQRPQRDLVRGGPRMDANEREKGKKKEIYALETRERTRKNGEEEAGGAEGRQHAKAAKGVSEGRLANGRE